MTTTAPARPHPLRPYRERIDPDATYTVRQIAGLMDMSLSTASGMATYGWLPGAQTRPRMRTGGREAYWSGAQLLELADTTPHIEYDHQAYSPLVLYRVGCRCDRCRSAHTSHDLRRRRAMAEMGLTRAQRARLIALVRSGISLPDAAGAVGTTVGRVYGRTTWDAAWAQELDEACWALCALGEHDPRCGTPTAYRGAGRGAERQEGCRGTGCRERHREASRHTRAQ